VRVGLFVTCLADLVRPRVAFATLRLLRDAGCEVVVPRTQTCCGQPAYNSGDRSTAFALARKVLDEFGDLEHVVVPSGSCGGTFRLHYLHLFADDPALLARAEQLAARTHELCDFLVNVLALDSVPGRFSGSVTYHDSCASYRELGIFDEPRRLLSLVPGLELREMDESMGCCGFGGTFSIKYGDISAKLAEDKCANLSTTGADAIVGGDLGCLLNIEGRLRRRGDRKTRVYHVAEILAGIKQG
jgi:L-lactate dehydrogenase complex protein LldE